MDPEEDEGCSRDERLKELLAKNLLEHFELLVLDYQHRLNTYVCLFYDYRYAEDIVQETFFNAYKALSKYSPSEIQSLGLRPWLFRIAHNLALNHRRKIKNPTPLSIDLPEGRDLLEETESGQRPSFETDVESRDELYGCIRRLQEPHKTIVIMHYIRGLDYNQIAKELHLPLNTAKSHGLRGFHELRNMMTGGNENGRA